jgi:23S rRNA (cytosine1962-C5)-methyltransferase
LPAGHHSNHSKILVNSKPNLTVLAKFEFSRLSPKMSNTYHLLDCGDQKKVEQFGQYKLIRPCPQALWPITKPELWTNADSEFVRGEGEKGRWKALKTSDGALGGGFPAHWEVESPDGLKWLVEPNEFGNVGIFTEHWTYANDLIGFFPLRGKILNLFTYSGSNCLTLVRAGYKVTAVDSSKSAMDTYTYNLGLNNLSREGQRLILEDVYKFVAREQRRGATYDGIMIDAPSYGRGTKGEVFKIEDDLVRLLKVVKDLLAPQGKLVLTLHSPRFTPVSLEIICQQIFPNCPVEAKEIIQVCQSGMRLPSGFLVKVG